MKADTNTIGLIGFGEAGKAFAKGWQQHSASLSISAFDIKFSGQSGAAEGGETATPTVLRCSSSKELNALNTFSLVTADQANAAAKSFADVLQPGVLFFDGNSCAPQTKEVSAQMIEAAGGRYVDVAIMSPVHPKLHRTPLLISGPHAADAHEFLTDLGMDATIVEGPIGKASSIKMVRSILMKGLEAVVMECVLAGRAAGVSEYVLDSLDVTYPNFDWRKQAARMMERATTHGARRASEMQEVAKTVKLLGLPPLMATSTVEWMNHASGAGVRFDQEGLDHATMADELLALVKR